MLHLLASLTWDPGIRGILDVAIAVAVLVGTPLILLTTNLGSRLSFHLTMTALFGWFTILFLVWGIYGLGYLGPAPAWVVQELSTDPGGSVAEQLHTVPQPSDLPKTPEDYLETNSAVAEAMTGRSTLPTMGDVVAADPTVASQLQSQLNGWEIVPSSDGTYGDAAAVAGEYLQENGFGTMTFDSSSAYLVGAVFERGGKPEPSDDSMFQRVVNRIQTTAMWFIADNPTHYAVVQVQPTIAQSSLPGEPPPPAVADPNQPVINVLMVRDLGAVRQPSFAFGILSFITFAILAYSLHRRDKEGMANRRAAEAAGSGV